MKEHDVVIIGGGAAGLTCAKYLDLANIDYVILSKLLGGNLFNATTIYNFPTYKEIEGSILATEMVENTNIEKVEFEKVVKYKDGVVTCDSGEEYEGKAIIIATGSNPVKLNIDVPENCVNYCVICDGYKYKNKDVIILGGSESAAQAALYLSSICNRVYVVYRKDEMKVCDYTKKLMLKKDNIECYSGKVLDDITPIENNKFNFVFSSNHGETDFRLIADGCFVCWGNKPATEFLIGSGVVLDENGYIVHGDGVVKPYTETSECGTFAAGDCLQGVYHQLSIAAGNGATCALDVINYLKRN